MIHWCSFTASVNSLRILHLECTPSVLFNRMPDSLSESVQLKTSSLFFKCHHIILIRFRFYFHSFPGHHRNNVCYNMHPITYRILHLNSAVFPCHCIEQEELLCSNRLSISVSWKHIRANQISLFRNCIHRCMTYTATTYVAYIISFLNAVVSARSAMHHSTSRFFRAD